MLEQGLAQLAIPSENNASTFDFGAFLLALPGEARREGLTAQELAMELAPSRTPHEMDRRFVLEFLTQMAIGFGGKVEGVTFGERGLSHEERAEIERRDRD